MKFLAPTCYKGVHKTYYLRKAETKENVLHLAVGLNMISVGLPYQHTSLALTFLHAFLTTLCNGLASHSLMISPVELQIPILS